MRRFSAFTADPPRDPIGSPLLEKAETERFVADAKPKQARGPQGIRRDPRPSLPRRPWKMGAPRDDSVLCTRSAVGSVGVPISLESGGGAFCCRYVTKTGTGSVRGPLGPGAEPNQRQPSHVKHGAEIPFDFFCLVVFLAAYTVPLPPSDQREVVGNPAARVLVGQALRFLIAFRWPERDNWADDSRCAIDGPIRSVRILGRRAPTQRAAGRPWVAMASGFLPEVKLPKQGKIPLELAFPKCVSPRPNAILKDFLPPVFSYSAAGGKSFGRPGGSASGDLARPLRLLALLVGGCCAGTDAQLQRKCPRVA